MIAIQSGDKTETLPYTIRIRDSRGSHETLSPVISDVTGNLDVGTQDNLMLTIINPTSTLSMTDGILTVTDPSDEVLMTGSDQFSNPEVLPGESVTVAVPMTVLGNAAIRVHTLDFNLSYQVFQSSPDPTMPESSDSTDRTGPYCYLKRTRLHKNDKILLSWNGWMIAALARAGQVLGESSYLDAAIRAYRFIHENMTDRAGKLFLRYREGEAAHDGQLDDYAVCALASLELYRVTFEVEYLQGAIRLAKQMVDLFEDREHGGYFMTASNAERLIVRPKETYDGVIPSGNSAAAMVCKVWLP